MTVQRKQLIRIETCGGIASGKTTFANLMQRIGVDPILENFQINPFWQAWYSDPAKYVFETEISFMLQHYHQIKRDQINGKVHICDYSFVIDIAYAELGLKGSQLKAFYSVYDEIKKELPPPSVLVHLKCDAEVELDRIRRRGRKVEESINLDFLRKLNATVEEQIERVKQNVKVLTIDSAQKNFADDESVKKEMTGLISNVLSKI